MTIGKKMDLIKILFFVIVTLNISSVFSSGVKKDDHCEEVLISLQQRLDQHIEHLEDTIEILKSDDFIDKSRDAIITSQSNIQTIQDIKEKIQQVISHDFQIESMVCFIMLSRFRMLEKRFQNNLLSLHDSRFIHAYTHPFIIENMDPAFRFIPESSVNLYQSINDVILSLASLLDLKNLKLLTRKFIIASPSMWKRFQGLEKDLGHPDEALLTMEQGAEGYCEASFLDKGDLYFYYKFFKEGAPIPDIDSEDFSYPEFLRPSPSAGSSPSTAKVVSTAESSAKKPQQRKSRISSSTQRRRKGRHQKAQRKTRQGKIQYARKKDLSEKHPPHIDSESGTVKHPVEIDDPKRSDDVIGKPLSSAFSSSSSTAASSSSAAESSSAAVLSDISESEEEPQPSLHLSGGHIKTIERIFNPRAYSKTRFSDFQTLWEYLGGRIGGQKSGGSHRSIIWKNSVIEGTYIPHNGHRYGPRAIKRLRHALDFIGCGKKFLESD